MRIDRLLCNLRLTRTRAIAARLAKEGRLRRNGIRIVRPSHPIEPGDILTIPWGTGVRVIEILDLPERRGAAPVAQACYRIVDPPVLDPHRQSAIGPAKPSAPEGSDRP